MIKHKSEFLLILIIIPIIAYVGWQAYKTWIASPDKDIANLEEPIPEKEAEIIKTAEPINAPEKTTDIKPEEKSPIITTPINEQKPVKIEEPITKEETTPSESKGTLNYIGYSERDPLKPSLPEKQQEEKPVEKPIEETGQPKEQPIEQPKEIIPPTFTITGIVWGNVEPRAIIDNEVHKIGDIIKGATILGITENGIQIIYEGKEFWIQKQGG
jgi:hypothetical protein